MARVSILVLTSLLLGVGTAAAASAAQLDLRHFVLTTKDLSGHQLGGPPSCMVDLGDEAEGSFLDFMVNLNASGGTVDTCDSTIEHNGGAARGGGTIESVAVLFGSRSPSDQARPSQWATLLYREHAMDVLKFFAFAGLGGTIRSIKPPRGVGVAAMAWQQSSPQPTLANGLSAVQDLAVLWRRGRTVGLLVVMSADAKRANNLLGTLARTQDKRLRVTG